MLAVRLAIRVVVVAVDEEQDPFVRSVMEAFPGTEIVSIRSLAQAAQPTAENSAPVEEDDDED